MRCYNLSRALWIDIAALRDDQVVAILYLLINRISSFILFVVDCIII